MQTVIRTLPSHWASALVNGDESGLENEDIEALNAFCESMIAQYGSYYCVDVSEDEQFMRWHDAEWFGVGACQVADFTFDVTERTQR